MVNEAPFQANYKPVYQLDCEEMMSKHRILVIDDDRMLLDLVRYHLLKLDYEVVTVETAEDGVRAICEQRCAIALTDLHLPDLNGIELVKRLKQVSPTTEIIMITGYGSLEAAIEATKAGAFFLIEKPLDFELLAVLLNKALEHRAQAEEIRRLQDRWEKNPAAVTNAPEQS